MCASGTRYLLTANYNRVQFFQLYYEFVEMDVDRYTIDGEYRQVMLSGRELSPDDLPPESAQRWVNRKAAIHPRLWRCDEPCDQLHARRNPGIPVARHPAHRGSLN